MKTVLKAYFKAMWNSKAMHITIMGVVMMLIFISLITFDFTILALVWFILGGRL